MTPSEFLAVNRPHDPDCDCAEHDDGVARCEVEGCGSEIDGDPRARDGFCGACIEGLRDMDARSAEEIGR